MWTRAESPLLEIDHRIGGIDRRYPQWKRPLLKKMKTSGIDVALPTLNACPCVGGGADPDDGEKKKAKKVEMLRPERRTPRPAECAGFLEAFIARKSANCLQSRKCATVRACSRKSEIG